MGLNHRKRKNHIGRGIEKMAYRMKKARELREMSTEQLRKRLHDIGATQLILRGRQKAGVFIPAWKNIKKEKARILTILGERSREEHGKQKGGFRRR